MNMVYINEHSVYINEDSISMVYNGYNVLLALV